MTASLPDADWRHRPGLEALLDALDTKDGAARYVGGAVRDTLLGHAVADVDIATVHTPQNVMDRLKVAGIKAVPTGIDHGTITGVLDGWPVEITTLRRDVTTDGRRATIAYTDSWREDAARRDFTINAMFANPFDGAITDYFCGLEDLRSRTVRFIGDAEARIAEDHLRILRYFRFFARFGGETPDAQSYAACVAQANSLMALSRERIADELLKLLALPDPTSAMRLMIEGGILIPVLPEITVDGLARLISLIARENDAGIAPSSVRRLAALLPKDAALAETVAARLKLSNKARKRLVTAISPAPSHDNPEQLTYWLGLDSAVDHLLRNDRIEPASIKTMLDWRRPSLPLTGGSLIARGLSAGPDVARALKELETAWVKQGFPAGPALNVLADQIVSKFQRARQ